MTLRTTELTAMAKDSGIDAVLSAFGGLAATTWACEGDREAGIATVDGIHSLRAISGGVGEK